MPLEFQCNATSGLQEAFQKKRMALLQRSTRRVEEIKAKRDQTKAQTEVKVQPEEPSKAKDLLSNSCQARSIPGQVEDGTNDTSSHVALVDSTHKKPELSIPGKKDIFTNVA